MSDSMYKVIELIGSSTESWEQADQLAYRTKVKVSFKYQGKE